MGTLVIERASVAVNGMCPRVATIAGDAGSEELDCKKRDSETTTVI